MFDVVSGHDPNCMQVHAPGEQTHLIQQPLTTKLLEEVGALAGRPKEEARSAMCIRHPHVPISPQLVQRSQPSIRMTA